MPSLRSLETQLKAIRDKVAKPSDPKEWYFCLDDGEEIPEHCQEQISERDTVTIRYYQHGWIPLETGEFEPSIGYVMERGGRVTCLYRSGKTFVVPKKM